MEDLSGYWTGEIQGTNVGGFAIVLEHKSERIYGHGQFYESTLGLYEYNIQGISSLHDISLFLSPKPNQPYLLGRVEVKAKLNSEGEISGKWKSEIETEGTFLARRQEEPSEEKMSEANHSVFIIHGHDELTKEKVARFVEKLGVETIILHEKVNKGMTIIEKFEEYSSHAGFAIALFTPDDVGHKLGKEAQKQPRARQNVILELGYFVGKIGRNKVCVLYRGDVELPSDMLGVVYTQLDDSGAWQLNLAKELKEAGYEIDLNQIIT